MKKEAALRLVRTLGVGCLVATTLACSAPDRSPERRTINGAGVVLDGRFDDWEWVGPAVADDPSDAPRSAVDLGGIQALDDEHWLFLALETSREVNLQKLPGTVHLLVDADGSGGEAGGLVYGMAGVDFVVEFSHAPEPDAPGAGQAVRVWSGEDLGEPVSHASLSLTSAPTWASDRFEIRLSRLGAPDLALPPLTDSVGFKVVYVEGGRVRDETPVGGYAFTTTRASAPPPGVATSSRIDRTPGTLRIAQWNVSDRSFLIRQRDFARILAALEPDVLLLDEVPDEVTEEDLLAFFALDAMADMGGWSFVLGSSGGRQRAVVAVRDLSLRPATALTDVRYGPEELPALRTALVGGPLSLLESEEEHGISTAGAWVDVGGGEVLFVALDLKSAGSIGDPFDRLRTVQARAVRRRIEEAVEDHGGTDASVVVGGDLNVVGSDRPLTALARPMTPGGIELVPVDAHRLGERTMATWRSPTDVFAPGRLDFILVQEGSGGVDDAFVFAVEDLAPELREALDLTSDRLLRISDHLPVVADLRLRR